MDRIRYTLMMIALTAILIQRLDHRRRELGMSHAALAQRCGVSEPTVKRILGGRALGASFGNVAAIAAALGMPLGFAESDAAEIRRTQARKKAEHVARMVQGTSGLESQGLDAREFERLVEQTYHELMAGSGRKLWAR
jgi:transcriptional regulator with XRE-family HTH domain